MNSLMDIQVQIEKLQKQATEIRSREFDKTVREIRAKMQAFGITLKDLQAVKGRGKAKVKTKAKVVKTVTPSKRVATETRKKKTRTVPAKYRGPNGETWSGRGSMPRWLATLVAQGKSKESFAIKR
ncbi:MAG: H-NS histone family protein [Hylemonella sp.]|nr:H-NS histone family protein [Hylemonella sp.]